MSKHTPGPLKIWHGNASCGSDGEVFVESPDHRYYIATFSTHCHPAAPAKANARLFVAADDLLTALVHVQGVLSDIGNHLIGKDADGKLLPAIILANSLALSAITKATKDHP